MQKVKLLEVKKQQTMLKNIEDKVDSFKKNRNLKLANQKYYKYLVDKITEGVSIHYINEFNESDNYTCWMVFSFDDKDNSTSYRAGDNVCTIFNNLNATKRISDFLIDDGLQPKELTTVIDMLKVRLAEYYGLIFSEHNYGLPYEYTKYKWGN